jgi:hypothetical protein
LAAAGAENAGREEIRMKDKKNVWQITKRGYNFYVVLSALQKAIRRGDARLACYWAAELYESGFGPALWNRLLIISAEDCWGTVTQHVEALRQEVKALEAVDKHINKGKDGSKKKPLNVLFVLKAAYLLALAQKCRDVDNFYCLVYVPAAIPEKELLADLEKAKDEEISLPPYTFDRHTKQGKIFMKKNLGWSEKRMTEHVIVTETAALKPRHEGQFDELPGQIPVFTEEELKKLQQEQERLSKESRKGKDGDQNRN